MVTPMKTTQAMSVQAVFGKLQQLFNPEKTIVSQDATITVTETGKQASLKSLNIVSVGQDAFALKLDECGFPGQKMFIAQHEMHRACDAVLFCMVAGAPFILCIELKSSAPTRHEVVSQFQSAHCLLDFINSLLGNYHGCDISNWPRRYFLFHDQGRTRSAIKQPMRVSMENNTPETALFWPVKNNESLFLRKLVGKPS
jgi:hypothetical protein